MAKAAVIMGSDSDWQVMKETVAALNGFGVETVVKVISAHRTPALAAEFAANAKGDGFGVIICAAGMAAHLAGTFAAGTTLPVIGVPIASGALSGMDALLATVQMPPGVPVATVGINGAQNAAVLAAQILAIADDDISKKLDSAKREMAAKIAVKSAKIEQESALLHRK